MFGSGAQMGTCLPEGIAKGGPIPPIRLTPCPPGSGSGGGDGGNGGPTPEPLQLMSISPNNRDWWMGTGTETAVLTLAAPLPPNPPGGYTVVRSQRTGDPTPVEFALDPQQSPPLSADRTQITLPMGSHLGGVLGWAALDVQQCQQFGVNCVTSPNRVFYLQWDSQQGAPTGATAGAPATFTPANSGPPPANLAAMAGITASPTTAWTAGQFVQLADNSRATWNGSAWIAA